MIKDIIKQSQLFAKMDDASLDEIRQAASVKKTAKGEIIFYDGDPAHAFFIVGSGKVKVFKLSSEGKEQILMIASPGDSFAEAAMFSGGEYPACAEALDNGELVIFNRERFIAILNRNPSLSLSLIARLSELLRKLTRLVEELSLTDVTTRLAHFLVHKLDEKKDGDKSQLTLSEKKSVIASQLGTIPETLSRSLAKLTKENIIEVSRSEIKILDYKRLREISTL